MDTENFYRSVLPGQGLRVLAVFKNGLKNAPTHQFFESDDDLIEAARSYDSLGKNVYHACASYSTATNRKGENAAAAKALWVDLDVGPTKPFASVRDAAEKIETFRVAVGLHAPHFVVSGNGLHAYFAFDSDVTIEQWTRTAAAFAACMDHAGVAHDSSRTEDIASILRVPGTRNYKSDPPSKVRLIRLGEEASIVDVFAKLRGYADKNNVIFADSKAKPKQKVTNDLIGERNFPPSVGSTVAEKCPTLAEVEQTGGDCSYEVWWRAIGVAKHTTQPEETAIHWTRNRAATGHDKHDALGALNAWDAGPTTCAEFSKHSKHCAGCKFNGKVTSPIRLGIPDEPPVVAEPRKTMEPVEPWTFKAEWILKLLAQYPLSVGFNGSKMTMTVKNDDGTNTQIPICSRYWQVMKRVRSTDGVWQLEIAYEEYGGTRTFMLDSAAVTSPDVLRKAFSARELHIESTTRAMQRTQDVLKWEQDMLHNYKLEVTTYPTLGWATESGTPTSPITGEFVIGKEKLAPRTPPTEVILSDRVDPKFVHDFRTAGTTPEWVALVDRVYNRPGAEAYQFVISAMFAAPLIKLAGGGEWHGIPIGLTGDSGAAKTSTALVAMSVYGPPSLLRFNGNASKDGGQGDTPAALAIKMGSLNNLPFVIDEVTSVESDRLAAVMFMLSAGRQKDRAESSGKKLVENNHRWDTISLITGNDSLHERLRELRRQNTQDATMLRCFEVPIYKAELKRVFNDIHRTTIDDDLLKSQYGCVGREWLQYVVDNRAKIAEVLSEQRRKFEITSDDMSDIRFYKDLLVTVQVASVFAKQCGFIHWDLKAMMTWARSRLLELRDSVNQRDWEGTISDFVGSLYGRTIVTSKMSLGRGRRASVLEMPREPLSSAKTPCARKAVDDRLFVVTANSVREWCKENRVAYIPFLQEMHQRGYLKPIEGKPLEHPRLINIGSGTTVTRPQAPCFEFDYNMISVHQEGNGEESPENVFPISDRLAPTTNELNAAPVDAAKQ